MKGIHKRPQSPVFGIRAFAWFILPVLALVVAWMNNRELPNTASAQIASTTQHAQTSFARLPLSFSANRGQFDESVKFEARGAGYDIQLASDEIAIRLRNEDFGLRNGGSPIQVGSQFAVLGLKFIGANRSPQLESVEPLPGKAHYLHGNDPANWQRDVPTFASVRYRDLYPGVSAVFYGNQRQLEYDFVVAPEADPSQIKLKFSGAEQIEIDANGDLLLKTSGGTLRQHRPVVYQQTNGTRHEIEARYKIHNPQSAILNEASFELGDYDRSRELVIDPVLSYSSFLGGSGDEQATGIAVDASGAMYVTGSTTSMDFPTVSAQQAVSAGSTDLFVTKMRLNADGSATLLFSTFIGGRDEDRANGLAVDSAGNVYVAGVTTSTNFPTANAAQSAFGSSAVFRSTDAAANWAPRGNGLSAIAVAAMAIDPIGSANAGTVYAATLGGGVFKTTNGGGVWIAANGDLTAQPPKLLGSSDARALAFTGNRLYAGTSRGLYSTTDGGATWNAPQLQLATEPAALEVNRAREDVRAIAVDPTNPAIVYTGVKGGVFKSTDSGFTSASANIGLPNLDATTGLSSTTVQSLGAAGSTTLYAGTTGGVFKTVNSGAAWTAKNSGLTDLNIVALEIDPANANTIYAGTPSGVFKTTNGGDAWAAANMGLTSTQVRALAIDGSTLYAVTAGGVFKSADGGANWVAANNGQTNTDARALAVRGETLYLGAAGASDAVLVKLSPSGNSLLFSTYLGGGATDVANAVAVDASGNAFVTGGTISTNFPLQAALNANFGGVSDAFVAKLNTTAAMAKDTLVYSTYLGGNSSDQGNAIAVDSAGNVYLTGATSSPNFPVSDKALQKTYGNAAAGNTSEVASGDAFVAKLSASGDQLLYSTYFGGADSDVGKAIALGAGNSIYFTGVTLSNNFAVSANAFSKTNSGKGDAFATVLNPISATGESAISYSTFLGGDKADQGNGIAVNSAGQAFVTGSTASANFPVVDAINPVFNGAADAFVVRLEVTGEGKPVFSTFLGGSGGDSAAAIVVDSGGSIYVAGVSSSGNFPVSEAALDKSCCGQGNDAFVAKIAAAASADLSITKQATGRFRVGEKAAYLITVTNAGPGLAAAPLRVLDVLPAELSFDSFTGADWSCSAEGQTVTCTSTKALAANASSTFSLMVKIVGAPAASSPLVNTASVQSLSSDSAAANNSSTSSVATVEPACSFAIAPASQAFTIAGGASSVAVTAQDGCAWQAIVTSGADFISITSGANGAGNGAVNFSVAANTSLSPRSGSLTIAGQNFAITQAGVVCQYAVTPDSQAFDQNGGNGAVTIQTTGQCSWQVGSDSGFVTLSGVGSGSGNGMVSFNVTANSGAAQRAGSLTVTGLNGFSKTISILQGSATQAVCTFALTPTNATLPAKGGDRAFFVDVTPGNCEWTATTTSDFISVTSDRDQSGSAFITYLLPQNPTGSGRNGSIVISQKAGTETIPRQTFAVNQEGQPAPPVDCVYSLAISPANQNQPASGGDGMVLVTAGTDCAWNAAISGGSDFIAIESGASGSGSGAVKFKVAANTGVLPRNGILTIAGQTVFIRQAGLQSGTTCALTIDPVTVSFAAKGGDGAFFVNSSLDTCEWTVGGNAAFIRVASDRNQSGSAFIAFVVEPNTGGSARTGTITVAGTGTSQTFTITQAGSAQGAQTIRRRGSR
ncbi:MAG: SBBP repeat-containing protein [Acidobacteriota bacterium]|nr:SBBP repeat-containing protein [Acidobacteriota bacterium]